MSTPMYIYIYVCTYYKHMMTTAIGTLRMKTVLPTLPKIAITTITTTNMDRDMYI